MVARKGVASPFLALSWPMQHALQVLLEAYAYSQDVQNGTWQFAVELPTLLEAGCTRSALRWLASQGYVEHAIETTRANAKARSFRRVANLSMIEKTCFVLTASGLALAQAHRVSPTSEPAAQAMVGTLPCWDAKLRELRVGGVLVKQFRVPAANQELILDAFQEEGWPSHLDDPLPPQTGMDPKRRLHETIDRLNRSQKHRLIRFHGDGTGRGVRWELLETADRSPIDRL
jgi:hypothetical protein